MPSTGQGTRKGGHNNTNNAIMTLVIIKGPFTEQGLGARHCGEHIISMLSSEAPCSQSL